jgi:hypothetical protein
VIEEETTARPDFGALRHAIEGRDAEALIGFYAEDAELRVLNGDVPGDLAFELKGRTEIERYLRAVCDQQMSCLLEDEVVFSEGSIEFREVCSYPDGARVLVRTTLELDGEGKIRRQIDVARSARRDDESERSER